MLLLRQPGRANAIAGIQGSFSQIQQRFAEEDPLVAAKWFAQAAASAYPGSRRIVSGKAAANERHPCVAERVDRDDSPGGIAAIGGERPEISSPLAAAAQAPNWQPVGAARRATE